MKSFHRVAGLVVLLVFLMSCIPANLQAAIGKTSYQSFTNNVSRELNQYIKKSGGTISLEYRDLITDEIFQINSENGYIAASTIKLPLAMYVMELADLQKIDLDQKLTYKSYHYIEGSGVVQYDKVGTRYTVRDLLKKAMIYSDNIAFNMLKERVGQKNYVSYMKALGASYSSPDALSKTSARDLVIYMKHLYNYSQKSENGRELVSYLQQTIYNETIPKGVNGVKTAHKVGMIPMYEVSNDVAIVYDQNPYALAVMTNGLTYEKSKKVIADITAIIHKHHLEKNEVKYIIANQYIPLFLKQNEDEKMGLLKKYFIFHVTSNDGPWLGVPLGQSTPYLRKVDANNYSLVPKIFNTSKLTMDLVAKTKNDSSVLITASTDEIVIAHLYEGAIIQVKGLGNGYYATLIGNRIGYIKATDIELELEESDV